MHSTGKLLAGCSHDSALPMATPITPDKILELSGNVGPTVLAAVIRVTLNAHGCEKAAWLRAARGLENLSDQTRTQQTVRAADFRRQ